jgi:hypothetical protein
MNKIDRPLGRPAGGYGRDGLVRILHAIRTE